MCKDFSLTSDYANIIKISFKSKEDDYYTKIGGVISC